jgi:ABC-type multidrug transport system fused ATPase/permease subunit
MSGEQARWPGAIAYVPQDVAMSSGTIKENITLGFPDNSEDQTLIDDALRLAQLSDFITSLPQGLDTQVGERGTKLSGGQRQRLGIARAMFTKPKLLVLDEATSALDGQTESDISSSILELKGTTTVVMIAHRLSTVRFADKVIYIDEGKILAQGTFDEVREEVPNFEKQAKLMGL